ncbi:MAG: DUF167 family protein [Candidatus Bathyarchaeia archaeon]
MKVTEAKNGVVLEIFVKPDQAEFGVKIDSGEIIIFCTEKPVNGRVNKEVVKELSKIFHAKIEIVSGLMSRQKRLLVNGVSKNEVESLLRAESV